MGLYRDESGRLIDVDDSFADAHGYVPAHPAEFGALISEAGKEQRADDQGVTGGVRAFGNRASSALTFGGTDALLGATLTPLEKQRVLEDIEAHPYLSTAGDITGAVAGGLALPGSALARTPAGYLGQAVGRGVESGLTQGGVRGTAKALGAMGVEGAAQGAGQHIGYAALGDREVTAEGLAGSAGIGFAFGAGGGGAALGVVKGSVAARRLFSRVMEGRQTAQAAESSWKLASQEALDADTATMRAAEIRLEQIRTGKAEAMRGRNVARASMNEERIRASMAEPRPDVSDGVPLSRAEGPEPLIDVAPQSGPEGATQAYVRPAGDREAVQRAADAVPQPKGAATKPFARPEGSTQRISRGEPTDLEAQLQGTKGALDEGVPLKDIKAPKGVKASKGNESDSIEGWLQEKKALDDDVLDAARATEDIRGANELRNRRHTALSDIRYRATDDLLGPQVAKMERELQDIVDEYKEARAGLGEISDGVPEALNEVAIRRQLDDAAGGLKPVGPEGGTRNVRGGRARQILDDAHEEALLRAKYGADPQAAGRALSEAEELEKLLAQIDDVSDGVPRMVDGTPGEMFADQLANDIRKIWAYEKASAKLADVIGEAAHPSSLQMAKALRDAEKDSMRKVMDRSARAVEDVAEFGPTYATPKERVAYARERLNDAQKNVDELNVQEMEARQAVQGASKKVREGEKAKRAALRPARAGSIGAQDVGGAMEFIDIPGLPKPSDLPIVGPLLGMWLKARLMAKGARKLMGRVPATADARVAASASQTRDRLARAVDRSLRLTERGGKFAMRAMPPVAGILSARIYNDGGEDPGPKAPIQKQAAARMREIAAYVHAPNAIEIDVRRELRGVTDPDLIAAAEKHRRFMIEYIMKHMPKMPEPGLLKTHDWEPSAGQAMGLARRLDAMNDPAGVFERLAQEREVVSLEASDTVRDVYPRLFQEALRRAVERAGEAEKIPYRTRVQMTLLYKMPFEPALSPENFQITQSVYERKPPAPAALGPDAAPAAPPVPSVAQPTNLSQSYMPSFDRR
jgi:hypothetical protein